MLRCINDKSKKYKGNEPSPRGLGYCAHVEKLYSYKKGKDGKIWKVIITKNRVKRWVKLKNNKPKEDKIKKFINSKLGEKIIKDNVYYLNVNNISSKKITIPIVKKAIVKYLNSHKKYNVDRHEILKTDKWKTYKFGYNIQNIYIYI